MTGEEAYMRRIIVAIATFAVAGTLFAGMTFADSARHRARVSKPVPNQRTQPKRTKLSKLNDEDSDMMLPVGQFGGY
jgi:hypothetical protein